MFDVLHQLIDRVHGWRSEEDRVNAHAAVDDYRAEQEGDAVTPTDESVGTSGDSVTGVSTDTSAGRHEESSGLFTPTGDKSSK